MTTVNISLCLLVTYFMCNHGDDITGADDVTRQRSSSWLQPVTKFVDKLLHNNRHNTRYLQLTFTLISRLFDVNTDIGMSS